MNGGIFLMNVLLLFFLFVFLRNTKIIHIFAENFL